MTTIDPDTKRGMYRKYEVQKLRPVEGFTDEQGNYFAGHVERIDPGPCFVLAYATDPHARVALAAYADSCEADYPQLAADLRQQLVERGFIGTPAKENHG